MFFAYSALHYLLIVTKLTRFIGHVGSLLDMEFHESSKNGRRDRAEEVFCSSSTVPFIIDRSRSNLQLLSSVSADCYIMSFRKIS